MRRGGELPTGMSAKAIKQTAIGTRQKMRSRKRDVSHLSSVARPYIMYINHKKRTWKMQQPLVQSKRGRWVRKQGKRKDLLLLLTRCRRQWKESIDLRTAWTARRREELAARPRRVQAPDLGPHAAFSQMETAWGLGDQSNPVRLEVIADTLEEHAAATTVHDADSAHGVDECIDAMESLGGVSSSYAAGPVMVGKHIQKLEHDVFVAVGPRSKCCALDSEESEDTAA